MMCMNGFIVVAGGKPLFFFDYYTTGKLVEDLTTRQQQWAAICLDRRYEFEASNLFNFAYDSLYLIDSKWQSDDKDQVFDLQTSLFP